MVPIAFWGPAKIYRQHRIQKDFKLLNPRYVLQSYSYLIVPPYVLNKTLYNCFSSP